MPRILRSPATESDALEIWSYIAVDNVGAADRLLDRIDQSLRLLAEQPNLGRSADELASSLRLFPVGNYLVFYRPLPDGIEVVRLLHGARDITGDLFRGP